MNKVLKDILTGINGETYDLGRLLWAVGVLTYIGLAIYALIKGQLWQPESYGIGLGAVLAGGGAGIGLKKATEPDRK